MAQLGWPICNSSGPLGGRWGVVAVLRGVERPPCQFRPRGAGLHTGLQ